MGTTGLPSLASQKERILTIPLFHPETLRNLMRRNSRSRQMEYDVSKIMLPHLIRFVGFAAQRENVIGVLCIICQSTPGGFEIGIIHIKVIFIGIIECSEAKASYSKYKSEKQASRGTNLRCESLWCFLDPMNPSFRLASFQTDSRFRVYYLSFRQGG